jgi:hypothetical protein
MQFNRIALREAAEAALKAAQQAHDAYNQRRADEHKVAREEWLEDHGEAWLTALPKLRDKLRKGRPVTFSDLPRDRGRVAAFDRTPPEAVPYTGGELLRSLIRVLDTIEGETVSNYALAELGISRDALRAAVRHLGKGGVRA